jgi:hypothetical protein
VLDSRGHEGYGHGPVEPPTNSGISSGVAAVGRATITGAHGRRTAHLGRADYGDQMRVSGLKTAHANQK